MDSANDDAPGVQAGGFDSPEHEEVHRNLVNATGMRVIYEQEAGTKPLVAGAVTLDTVVDVLLVAMGLGAVRAALLMVYEKTYTSPMTGLQRIEAGRQLDNISHSRLRVDGKSSLVLPKGDLH